MSQESAVQNLKFMDNSTQADTHFRCVTKKKKMINIKFLRANNGDSILINFEDGENGRNILIDGGTQETYKYIERRTNRLIDGDLKVEIDKIKKNYQKIDLLVLTHVDDDHIGGFLSMFGDEEFEIDMISEVWFNSGKLISSYFMQPIIEENVLEINKINGFDTSIEDGIIFEDIIESHKIWRKKLIKSGDVIDKFGLIFKILSPSELNLKGLLNKWKKYEPDLDTSPENDYHIPLKELVKNDKFRSESEPQNGSSIAFILTFDTKNFVFLSDAHTQPIIDTLKNEFKYSENNQLKAEFVKISHHGSKYNTNTNLLKLINTSTFVISTDGSENGHPNKITLARIIKNKETPIILFNYPHLIEKIFLEKDYEDYNFIVDNTANFTIY
jgi:beta-lactamase superfamily II metal-dependent hydrolase